MRVTYIYALVDPRSDEVRYIGKTCTKIENRLNSHIHEAKASRNSHYRKNRWILTLLADGIRPVARELELVTAEKDWREAEKRWIAYGRSQGWDLTNLTDGGEGVDGYVPTEETRRKISNANKGRKDSEETKQRKREANAGKRPTEKAFEASIATRAVYLPTEAYELMGKVSDARIAKQFNVKTMTVRWKRMQAGIPTCDRKVTGKALRFVLPQECIDKFGIISDEQLARDYGVSPQVIARRRVELGISLAPSRKNPIFDSQEFIDCLGTMSDSAIAEKFNVHPASVKQYRRKKGISSFPTVKAMVLGNEEFVSLLGTIPDAAIAEKFGLKASTVANYRRELGIASTTVSPRKNPVIGSEEFISYLGTMPDNNVAKKFNVSKGSVAQYRRKMGISPFDPKAVVFLSSAVIAPQPGKQTDFLSCSADVVLYGGSAGG